MCCELHNAQATEGFTEQFIITTVDAQPSLKTLLLQQSPQAWVFAMGAIRNNPQTATDLLNLPKMYTLFLVYV